jgi:hypothetical protein
MEPIPLPSHIHYELLLQLLERKTLEAASQNPLIKGQIHQLIITLRKAFAQQKQLETTCEQTRISYEYHWSLNHTLKRETRENHPGYSGTETPHA